MDDKLNHGQDNPFSSDPCNLVTGALGFVGLHLIRSLIGAGIPIVGAGRHGPDFPLPQIVGDFQLVGPVSGFSGSSDLPQMVKYQGTQGSFLYQPLALENAQLVEHFITKLRPSMIYHLAAQSSAAVSFRDPSDTFVSNVMGTLNLLEAVRILPESERPVLLSVGSAEEYGPLPDQETPITEEAATNPISPYGVSKVSQTLLCKQYVESYDLPIMVVRSFSHTGPGQDTRFAFPSFAKQIADAEKGRGPTNISVGDLSAIRDFLDVRDVVEAYRCLMKEGILGKIYNVCSGSSLTIRQGLTMLIETAKVEITVSRDPDRCRPSDIPYLVGDNTKLKLDSGWEPSFKIKQTLCDVLEASRKELS